MKGRFRLNPSIPPLAPLLTPGNPAGADALAPANLILDAGLNAIDPSTLRYGAFASDLGMDKYNRRWDSMEGVYRFIADVERDECVEFRLVQTRNGVEGKYLQRLSFLCARHGTGGPVKYQKRNSGWARKIPTKVTDCTASLTVKTYPGTRDVLGIYDGEHNHPIGPANLCFTRIPLATRDWIASQLRLHIKSDKILDTLHHPAGSSNSSPRTPRREDFITLSDVRRIEKGIQAEDIQYHSDDSTSLLKWVERLQHEDSLLAFKSRTCPIPAGSTLGKDTFLLAIQTPWQRSMLRKYGSTALYIDGTHNTTMYENMVLTTLLVRDDHGHGIPVAWILASSGTEETLAYFLSLVIKANPGVSPTWIMSDRDLAQINACRKKYPLAIILLCWWHVLHAWQQHFVISQNLELWDLLKAWIRIESAEEFKKTWDEIRRIAPPDFLAYLEQHWMPEHFLKMWSAQYRRGRSIEEKSDTNMLVEAWHHVLKGKFLEGKRNRRIDHLVYLLVTAVLAYYDLKQRRQLGGFEGPSLYAAKRKDVLLKSSKIVFDDVEVVDEDLGKYAVRSQTDRTQSYEVDIPGYTCTCPDYPLIQLCKHICAVQTHYPDTFRSSPLPTTPLEHQFGVNIQSISPANSDNEQEPTPTDPVHSTPNHEDFIQGLERLVARIRLSPDYVPEQAFVEVVGKELERLQANINLLPAPIAIAPNQKSWPETQAVMLPPKKGARKRAGDKAYGAGEQSGKKAKKTKAAVKKASLPIPQTTVPPPVTPAPLIPVSAHQPQPIPPAQHPFSAPMYPAYMFPIYYHPIPYYQPFAAPIPPSSAPS